ncbi:TolC family protein [Myxococcus sp. RHSTA-1-4]|uniref:TolC family protein n=1 Tax=Myxococcus sp. RHSTA-1-4 TaxID=2874601 RepID=UPI001CBFD254|nr:TolC family protein [Myxococcus sp. RHSTA-1-4]MBZ4415305.1 TolC family protein [Myxococcus sp. RHSTA-1-4]
MSHRLAMAAPWLAIALLLPRPGVARTSSELTLEEALVLARQRAPALLEAAGRVAEARGPVAGASPPLRDNPTLELEAGPSSTAEGRRGVDVAVGLVQPLELGGKQGARRESARAGLARETAARQDTERRVLGEVAATFLRALHARERTKLAREAEATAVSTAQSTQRRFEAGDVPVVDVNVARVALARARADVAGAEGEEASLLYMLRALLGVGLAQPLGVRGELRALAVAGPPAASTGERPDIVALESEVAQAEADLRLGRRSAWPDVGVGVRYQREVDETAVLGTLSVPVPLFSWGQEARVTGEARVRRLQTALEAARRARDVQVEAARVQHRKRQEALELLEREALPLLADNESLALKSYEAGEMGLAEFLLVRRDTLEARTAYLDSLLQAALARVQLAVETGALP